MASNVCAAPFSSERLDRNCVISSGSKHFRRVIHCRDFIEDGQSLVPPTLLANFFEINLLANTRRLRHLPHCGHATLKIETIRKRDSGLTVRSRTLHRLRSGREKHEELSRKQQASLARRSLTLFIAKRFQPARARARDAQPDRVAGFFHPTASRPRRRRDPLIAPVLCRQPARFAASGRRLNCG